MPIQIDIKRNKYKLQQKYANDFISKELQFCPISFPPTRQICGQGGSEREMGKGDA